jgi:hypothetical protein
VGPETHVHKITNAPVFFMEREVMDFWREICITSRSIKKTGALIVITSLRLQQWAETSASQKFTPWMVIVPGCSQDNMMNAAEVFILFM